MSHEPQYSLHLEARLLAQARAHNYISLCSPRSRHNRVMDSHLREGEEFWQNFVQRFDSHGPAETLADRQLHLAVTIMTAAAELAEHGRGDEDGKFAAKVTTLLSSMEKMVLSLIRPVKDIDVPKHLPYNSDEFGLGLYGRLYNLIHAQHVCDLALNVCAPEESEYRHKRHQRWLRLSAKVARQYGVSLNHKAKELLCAARHAATK